MHDVSSSKKLENCVQFLRNIYKQHHKKVGLIAVSGGIDSAVSLSLLTQALGPKHVHAVLLPYEYQDMCDAQEIVQWNKLPAANIHQVNIQPIVAGVSQALTQAQEKALDEFRKGNSMARARMIVVYDLAKQLDALVCGTENKSEKYLGYFTRFGDEASDIEPLQDLYKTQVRELAVALEIPEVFLKKAPSAGLWQAQTDEQELGFSYQVADQVLEALIDTQSGILYLKLIEGDKLSAVATELATALPEIPKQTITKVLKRVQSQQFKHEVPYTPGHIY